MAAKRKTKICDRRGARNKLAAEECKGCGAKRFAPDWVRQQRRVNRSFAVQVTDPHPLTDEKTPRLTLYKWWPGGNTNFNINSADQWA